MKNKDKIFIFKGKVNLSRCDAKLKFVPEK